MLTVIVVIWMERKVIADMQTRPGPLRAGPRGILITLADGAKLFFKEGISPAGVDLPVYLLAPLAAVIPAMLAFAVIPYGPGVVLWGHRVPFQIADLSIGILWVLAMASVSVYGILLAGWASGSNYPLLGSIRSTAQVISYEVGMSLALIAVILYCGTVTTNGIVAAQARHFDVTGLRWLPKWNVFLQFPAFVLYMTAALAEINRPPFDLPEGESELVAGYQTEYSGMKFAMFYLAEYLAMVTISSVGVTLFLGGWRGPIFAVVPWLWPVVWFLVKLFLVMYALIWVRATLPRFRYDKLMDLGWKVLIPAGLLWIMITAAAIALPLRYTPFYSAVLIVAGITIVVLVLGPLFTGPPRGVTEEADAEARP
jgi:NADH-quinone oxidoreductase subunit H